MKLCWFLLLFVFLGCKSLENPEIVKKYESFGENKKDEARFEAAKVRHSVEDLPDSLAVLRGLIEKFPQNIPVHREYQDQMIRAKQRDVLVKEYRDLLRAEKTPAHLYLLARLLHASDYDSNEFKEAEKLLHDSVKIEPAFYWGYFGLGVHELDADQGNHDKAKDYFDQALEIDPDFALCYWELAEMSTGKDPDAAIDYLKDYLRILPQDKVARFNLGILYLNEKKAKEAKNQFDWVLQKDPLNVKVLYGTAQAYLYMEQYPAAVSVYQRIVEADPRESLAHYNLGIVYEDNLKDFASALREYDIFLQQTEQSKLDFFGERINVETWKKALREKLGFNQQP